MRAEYDFDYRKAKPNRFAGHVGKECTVVVLDADVSKDLGKSAPDPMRIAGDVGDHQGEYGVVGVSRQSGGQPCVLHPERVEEHVVAGAHQENPEKVTGKKRRVEELVQQGG